MKTLDIMMVIKKTSGELKIFKIMKQKVLTDFSFVLIGIKWKNLEYIPFIFIQE